LILEKPLGFSMEGTFEARCVKHDQNGIREVKNVTANWKPWR